MTLGDDDLRQQLERRTKAAPLEYFERVSMTESVRARASSAQTDASRPWLRWAAIPATAALLSVGLLLAVTLPRSPQLPGASSSPSDTSTASLGTTPAPSATTGPASSLLTTNELVTLSQDSSAAGRIVIANALIATVIEDPGQSPVKHVVVSTTGASVPVIGAAGPQSGPSAFRVGRELEYLGPAKLSADGFAWSVPMAISSAPADAAADLYPVEGWLMQTVAAPCAAPPDFSSAQDYWCGGSWLGPEHPPRPADGSVLLSIPGAMHVQWPAYQDFALDPQLGSNGGEPRFGIYLVRPAGCPPNVMGDCPVWEVVGRLQPPPAPSAVVPSPTPPEQPEVQCLGGIDPETCESALPVALAAVRASGWSPVQVWVNSGQLCPTEDCLFDPTANFPYPLPPDGEQWIGNAEIAFAETDKHAGMQLASGPEQLHAVLVGYAVPALNWCSGECPTSTIADGLFRLEFVLPHLDWHSSDSISGTAILSFAGDGPTAISGSGHPIGFSYVEVDGDRSVYPVFSADCARHRLDPATPMTQVLSKSGVLQTDFQSSFVPGPDIKLPVGSWDITATVGFFDGLGCSGVPHDLKATLRISVTD